MAEDKSNILTLEVPAAAHTRLSRLARATGTTKQQCAQVVLLTALQGLELQECGERLAAIERSLASLKGALGRGIGAVLMNVTELPDDQIKQWVFGNMLRPTETMDDVR